MQEQSQGFEDTPGFLMGRLDFDQIRQNATVSKSPGHILSLFYLGPLRLAEQLGIAQVGPAQFCSEQGCPVLVFFVIFETPV